MYRLGQRVRLTLPEPYAEASVEVDSIVSEVIALRVVTSASAFLASDTDGEDAAMLALARLVIDEARPSWDFVDGRGPIPATVAGLRRLPVALTLAIVEAWTDGR